MSNMKYSINLEQNIINCEFNGLINPKDLVAFITDIRNDPSFHKKLNTIADFRNATISKDYIEISMIADYVQATAKERGDFKLAVICGPEVINSASLFKSLASDKHIKVCINDTEANEWVGESC